MRKPAYTAFALLCLGFAPASQAQLFSYELGPMEAVDLGTFGGEQADALDVNDNGDVVGWAEQAGGNRHAFLLRGGNTVKQDISSELGNVSASANGINNLGWIVGDYQAPQSGAHTRAFLWIEGLPLKTLQPDFEYSRAFAINITGDIVGVKSGPIPGIPGSPCVGFSPLQWASNYNWYELLWCSSSQNGVRATDINNQGHIVGWEDLGAPLGIQSWMVYANWTKVSIPKPNASTCGMWANGVNFSGNVVGRVCLNQLGGSKDRAFIHKKVDGITTTLGVLSGGSVSQARGVNDQNFVAGMSNQLINGGPFPDTVRDRAFIYHADFGMKALPLPSGFFGTQTSCAANAISLRNSDGLIRVAGYCIKVDKRRAVRWDVTVTKKIVSIPPLNL